MSYIIVSTIHEEAILPAGLPLRCVFWAMATASHSEPYTGPEWGRAIAMHKIQLTMQPDNRKQTQNQCKTSCNAHRLYAWSRSETLMAYTRYK